MHRVGWSRVADAGHLFAYSYAAVSTPECFHAKDKKKGELETSDNLFNDSDKLHTNAVQKVRRRQS